ncbi:hypothetical protein PS3A_07910 [Pseudomonas sp. 3A(2025)]
MSVKRSKEANTYRTINIHNVVGDWYNSTQIPYIAHAFVKGGGIVCLSPAVTSGASNKAASHPDQQYWRIFNSGRSSAVSSVIQGIASAGGVSKIERIDIDCKLMPCNSSDHACLYAVPALMRTLYGLNNIDLRIFSHADENMGSGGSSKRVILTNTSADSTRLDNDYNLHQGWGWTP